MRILFIGGSNLVIKNGLSTILPGYLASQFNTEVDEIVNIAVPGSGSLFGLHNLLELSDTDRFDFVFIEYGINDYALHAKNPALWKAGFSGLIKTVKFKCPTAAVVMILLGRRDEKFHKRQRAMHARMREMAEEAGITLADIDAFFKSKSMAGIDFPQLYKDGAHYKGPLITNFIATLCAIKAGEAQAKKPKLTVKSRRTLFKDFESAFQALNLPVELKGRHEQTEFKNSKFHVQSITIKPGEELNFSAKDYPCGISFVSHKTSGSLLINVDGKESIIHSMHRRVQTGEFDFLLRHNPFYWLEEELSNLPATKELKITMRPIDSDDSAWDEAIIRPSYEMIPVDPGSATAVHLVGLTTIK